jgi:hypothetical protein
VRADISLKASRPKLNWLNILAATTRECAYTIRIARALTLCTAHLRRVTASPSVPADNAARLTLERHCRSTTSPKATTGMAGAIVAFAAGAPGSF